MNSSFSIVPIRSVRSLNAMNFNAPWPFSIKRSGWRKIGPIRMEKWQIPGQNKEIPELSPKFQKLNLKELRDYTGAQPTGYEDPISGEFITVKEMIPEIVVPDLTNFKLLPYVSFKTDAEIERRRNEFDELVKDKGSEEIADLYITSDQRWPPLKMTPKRLFDLVYAPKIRQWYKDGKYHDYVAKALQNKPASGPKYSSYE